MALGRRIGAAAVVVVLLVVAVVLGARALLQSLDSTPRGESCHVDDYTIDTGQAAVASQMVGVVLTRQLPEHASLLVLMAGLQESKLRNVASGAGDRDSVGVLQQRPSQGWGSVTQLSDVRFATAAFLTALVKVSGWQSMTPADAIQEVQVSADGDAYTKHEPEARALSDAFMGIKPASLSCTFPKPNKVAATVAVITDLTADLPVTRPTSTADGVTIPGASWPTATWFVANADRFGIESVDYANRTWARGKGWRESAAGSSAVVATMYKS